MHTNKSFVPLILLVNLNLSTPLTSATTSAPTIEWVQQIGTSSEDESNSVATDSSGNIYISGHTRGNLEGINSGSRDSFLSKFDSSGILLWTQQLGTDKYDFSWSVATDDLGNAYITNTTFGNLGSPSAGSSDAHLAKFDPNGNLVWSKQFGTSGYDDPTSITISDFGNVFVTGGTNGNLEGTNAGGGDSYLSKFDNHGNLLWTNQFGTSDYETSRSVAIDSSGNAYITGITSGNLDGVNLGREDVFISKFDSNGNQLWVKQIGTHTIDHSYSISVDAFGNSYITGYTHGVLEGVSTGSADAFLSKFDTDGNQLWTNQFGSGFAEVSHSVIVDSFGSVYVTGFIYGDLEGTNTQDYDTILLKFDSDGNQLWTSQFGSDDWDIAYSVSTDNLGGIFISGYTKGNFGGVNAGGKDAFLAKIHDPTFIPESSTLTLALLALAPLTFCRQR